jgi:signal transduction histidine kinase
VIVATVIAGVASELLTGKVTATDPPEAVTTADVVFSIALVTPLVFARRAPVAVFTLVMALCLAQFIVLDHVLAAQLAPLVATYSLVAYAESSRVKLIGVGVALAGGLFVSVRATLPGALDNVVLGFLAIAAQVLLAALLGDRRRTRAAQLELATARERARIARELHDVVAHSLSVMVLQADGGRYAPAAAAEALEQISQTGREALAQMRRLLGVLRAGDERPERLPQPGVAELDALVRRVADCGVPVELRVEGRARELPGGIDLTVYRVAQEALTNVLKHADSTTRVEVVLLYREDAVEVTVRDDGRGAAGDGSGQGLVGMRERAELQGGTLRAGPRAAGGYELHLHLPVAA